MQSPAGEWLDDIRILDSGIVCTSIGDLNNDGLNDVAVSYLSHYYFKVYYQSPTGNFSTVVTYPATKMIRDFGEPVVEIGDLDHDGLNDVVFSGGSYNHALSIYVQRPDGRLHLASELGAPKYLEDVAIGDFNGDGLMDLAAPLSNNYPYCYIVRFVQNADGSFPEVPDFYPSIDIPDVLEVGDVNVDGRMDLLVHGWGFPRIYAYIQNERGGFNPFVDFGSPFMGNMNHRGLAVGDLNGDGKPDAALVGWEGSGLAVYLNQSVSGAIAESSFTNPARTRLLPNYPNPFNPLTTLRYTLLTESHVNIAIFDLLGKDVSTLVDERIPAGDHVVEFDASGLSSGVYLCRLTCNGVTLVRKLLLQR
jgi:hypothetical protein